MLNADKILYELLQKVEISTEENRELILIKKLKEFLAIPLYINHMEVFFNTELEKATNAANIILSKAVSLYNIKEYKRSLEHILTNIFSFNPINVATIKLIIANLQGLKHFILAATMYYEYSLLTKELDSIYFSGVCYYMAQDNLNALRYFQLFLNNKKELIKNIDSKDLIKNCNNFIKLIEEA